MYDEIMGPAWRALPACVRATHAVGESRGSMQVSWGAGPFAHALARAVGFPRPALALEVVLRIEAVAGGLRWVRRMGAAVVSTLQTSSRGLLLESFGPIVCAFRLVPEAKGFRYLQDHAAIRIGRVRLRLPSWASPRVEASVIEVDDGTRTVVEISAPLIGRVLRYEGTMTPLVMEARA